jgi:hypothetical protein
MLVHSLPCGRSHRELIEMDRRAASRYQFSNRFPPQKNRPGWSWPVLQGDVMAHHRNLLRRILVSLRVTVKIILETR